MKNIQRLSDLESICAKKLVASSHFGLSMLLVVYVLFCIVGPLLSGPGVSLSDILLMSVAFCVLFVPIFVFLMWWPFRYVSADYKAGEKAVEKTIIERLQKVGFFEMQADSALGIMAGAIYYLWIPDETRTPPHRRFRIGLTTYQRLTLYGNGPIEVSYLPKSGIILSIDTPTYRYAAYEPPANRHQIKQQA